MTVYVAGIEMDAQIYPALSFTDLSAALAEVKAPVILFRFYSNIHLFMEINMGIGLLKASCIVNEALAYCFRQPTVFWIKLWKNLQHQLTIRNINCTDEIAFQSKTDYTTLAFEVTAETSIVSYTLGFSVYFDSPVAQKDFASFATALTTSWQASFMAESKLNHFCTCKTLRLHFGNKVSKMPFAFIPSIFKRMYSLKCSDQPVFLTSINKCYEPTKN